MLEQLQEFRDKIDDVFRKCLHKRITTYGNKQSASFLRWYAKYYHNIDIEYKISLENYPTTENYWEPKLFQKEIFIFNYRDVMDSVVLTTVPVDDETKELLKLNGFIKDVKWFDMYELIYENDYYIEGDTESITKRKTGLRDIQFLDYLEWKYRCNYIETVSEFPEGHVGTIFMPTTHREICSLIDMCHPTRDDGIFDFGCGKGSSIITFLDYGVFRKIGGVEYEKNLYETLKDNLTRMRLDERKDIECYNDDARNLKLELDEYNIFYFFDPFRDKIMESVINNIFDSYSRNRRRISIIYVAPFETRLIENKGFRLNAQMMIENRKKIASIYVIE